jgi:hypothetical protein
MRKEIKRCALALLLVVLLMGRVFGTGFQETINVWFNSIVGCTNLFHHHAG